MAPISKANANARRSRSRLRYEVASKHFMQKELMEEVEMQTGRRTAKAFR